MWCVTVSLVKAWASVVLWSGLRRFLVKGQACHFLAEWLVQSFSLSLGFYFIICNKKMVFGSWLTHFWPGQWFFNPDCTVESNAELLENIMAGPIFRDLIELVCVGTPNIACIFLFKAPGLIITCIQGFKVETTWTERPQRALTAWKHFILWNDVKIRLPGLKQWQTIFYKKNAKWQNKIRYARGYLFRKEKRS